MSVKTPKQVVIIGAGLAGIAAAIRLRIAGHTVLVLEKNADYGGKLSSFSAQGFRWDKGPSLFTSPEQVDELFEICGVNPRDHFKYVKHHTSCTYYFADKSSVEFSADREKLKAELDAAFSSDTAYKTLTYLDRSKETYKRIGDFFIDNPPVGLKDLFRKELIVRYPHFLTAKLRKTLHQYNHTALKEPKLVQIFDRFGTYNGSNPFKMSGLYSMIPHLEQNTGTFFPEKGMRDIADSLYKLAVERGVTFMFEQNILAVHTHEKRYTIQSSSGNFQAEKLICAIDHLPFYRDLLKDEKHFHRFAKQERSSSGLVFYWGIKEAIPQLGLHNIFFSEDYRAEFEQLFTTKKMEGDPTIYVHISSVVNAADAPAGGQNWFVMVNTPAGVIPSEEEMKMIRKKILDRIQKQFGVDLNEHIVCEQTWNSQGIEEQTGSFMGALYGASSNGKTAAMKRHGNKNRKYPNLYFCGGTVHPGGGIPLVLKSAKIVAKLIEREN
jgi:phytoene desaturase